MPERGIQPWWECFPEWWSSQLAQIRVSDLSGELVEDALLARAHTRQWAGRLITRWGPVPLRITWGPGTPFAPPLLRPEMLFADRHQLSDGSMCLLPPESVSAGFSGVKDIAFWLRQADQWLSGYFEKGWAQNPSVWTLLQTHRPGPGYRTTRPTARVLALPPAWQGGPPGLRGLMEIRAPRSGRGLSAVVAWETAGREGRWPEGAGLVEEGITLGGMWMEGEKALRGDFRGAGTARLIGDFQTLQRVSQAQGRPVVFAGHGSMGWFANEFNAELISSLNQYDPAFSPAETFLRCVLTPICLESDELDARRRAGREADVHERIAAARVMVVGLGALGSEVAHLLAQEGVRRFLLVDGDLLLPGNVTRHRADLSMAGLPKVEAVTRVIRRVNPEAEVIAVQGWFDALIPTLSPSEELTLIVGATGSEEQELIISEAAYELNFPSLHAWLEIQGRVLRVLRALPGRDPTLLDVATRTPRPIERLVDGESTPTHCAELVLPGSPLDLHAAANFVARRALDAIAGRGDPDNHWLFTPAGVSGRPDLPEALRQPFGLIAQVVAR